MKSYEVNEKRKMKNEKRKGVSSAVFPFSFFLFPFTLALLAGCHGASAPPTPRGYFGPTETMAQVVAAINANNKQIPTLWADPYFEATIVDEKHQSHFVNGEATLVYEAPKKLRLV